MAVGQAIPIKPKSGLLRVVSNSDMQAAEASQANADIPQNSDLALNSLARHIRHRMDEFRNYRVAWRITDSLLDALRTYRGEYSPDKLTEIKKFGGSEVYSRLVATKCRGATALLRDIYLGPERPWTLSPTPVPETPDDITTAITQLVETEVTTLQSQGQPIDPQQIQDRINGLMDSAEKASKSKADDDALKAVDQLDDILTEGRFYESFAEFLIDLPIYPYAVLKGPVVRRAAQVKWVNGQAVKEYIPKLFWYRVSPFDLYWSGSASSVDEAEFIERIRLTREDLLSVKGLPGYNDDAIERVLARFPDSGYRDWWDASDQQRHLLEKRGNKYMGASNLIDTAEYTGSVSGKTLIDWGMTPEEIPDPTQEYHVTAWLIDSEVIKAQVNPTPSQRAPYYITSFEKIPGGLIGEGLPDMLTDVQSVANATLRSLVNNMSIASGPQVAINDELVPPGETDDMYPWKRWHFRFDPMMSASQKPIDFFQPQDNSQNLMNVFERFSSMADEVSSLPRYMLGDQKVGGAGRTASGLAMLMGNASKTLQNVAATIDRDVIRPCIETLYELVMLSMPGVLTGDEEIVVKGVNYATKREQDRMRQLEFLQLTGNPIDMQIIGPDGRASILRSVAAELGLDHINVVPDAKTIQDKMKQAAAAQPPPGAPPGAPPGGPQVPGAAPGQMPLPNQIPAPQEGRAGPEQVRQPIEAQTTNQATGRPGMRAGG